jgi:hypothetical protein
MNYNNEDLQELFKKGAQGRTPEQFIKDTTHSILTYWLNTEKGRGEYKRVGGYWEVLYPILKKYQPDLLSRYENIIGDFNYFNEDVRKLFDQGNELYNLIASLQYMEERKYNQPDDVHYIEIEEDEYLPYIPNQNIDSQQYWGRENEE